jgi:hypothetical protein
MRNVIRLSLFVFVLGFAQSLSAQMGCTTGFTLFQVNCPPTCGGTVNASIPSNPGPYGVPFVCQTGNCCGSGGIPQCYPPGGYCIQVQLKNPDVQKRLRELAATSDLMIARCDGGGYFSFGETLTNGFDPALITRRPRLDVGSAN